MRRIIIPTFAALLLTLPGCERPAPPPPSAPSNSPMTSDTSAPAETGTDDAPSAPGVVEPLKAGDLSGWEFDDAGRDQHWVFGKAVIDPKNRTRILVEPGGNDLINPEGLTTNPYTKQKFQDYRLEVDVMLALGSNSGIFVHGDYEVQVLDQLPLDPEKPGDMDHGAIARKAAPKVLSQKQPGEWQTYVIEFRAPRFDADGKKTENARFLNVTLNGQLIHESVEVDDATLGGLTGVENPTGPVYLQGNEGAVAFRNIRVTPLDLD